MRVITLSVPHIPVILFGSAGQARVMLACQDQQDVPQITNPWWGSKLSLMSMLAIIVDSNLSQIISYPICSNSGWAVHLLKGSRILGLPGEVRTEILGDHVHNDIPICTWFFFLGYILANCSSKLDCLLNIFTQATRCIVIHTKDSIDQHHQGNSYTISLGWYHNTLEEESIAFKCSYMAQAVVMYGMKQ